jgi:hypothetical protein
MTGAALPRSTSGIAFRHIKISEAMVAVFESLPVTMICSCGASRAGPVKIIGMEVDAGLASSIAVDLLRLGAPDDGKYPEAVSSR